MENINFSFLRICEKNNNVVAFIEAVLDYNTKSDFKQSIISQIQYIIDSYKYSNNESLFKKLRIDNKYEDGYSLFLKDDKNHIKEEFFFSYDKDQLEKIDNMLKRHNYNLKKSKKILIIKLLIILIPLILTLVEASIFNTINTREIYLKIFITFVLFIVLDPLIEISILIKK